MPDFDVQQVREAAARAQHHSRTDLDIFDRLKPAQRRSWLEDTDAAMAVIVPAVTAQIRALHQPVKSRWVPAPCSCGLDYEDCRTVRLLDQIDASVRGDLP